MLGDVLACMSAVLSFSKFSDLSGLTDKAGEPKKETSKLIASEKAMCAWERHLATVKDDEVKAHVKDWHASVLADAVKRLSGIIADRKEVVCRWCQDHLGAARMKMKVWSLGQKDGSWKSKLSESDGFDKIVAFASKSLLLNETALRLTEGFKAFTQDTWMIGFACMSSEWRPGRDVSQDFEAPFPSL